MQSEAIAKAAVLIEALPYIRRFRGTIAVVKLGGSFMEEQQGTETQRHAGTKAVQPGHSALEMVCADVAFMRAVGIYPVVVHGGGKAISRAMEEAGLEPAFVDGLRRTGPEEMRIVEDVLVTDVNRRIVALLEAAGGRAEGLTSKGRCALKAEPLREDLGLVGRVVGVDGLLIRGLCDLGTIPVLAPIGLGPGGEKLNCNADEAASAVARALEAEKLVNVSDTHGIRGRAEGEADEEEEALLSHLSETEAEGLLAEGVITGGMIPKVRCMLEALKGGVGKAHIISGHVPHSLLLEIYTDRGVGTEIVS